MGGTEHRVNGAGRDRDREFYQVGFDAAWEIDFWKKYRSGVKAEAANYLAQVANYDNALVSLTAEVARTYAVIRTLEVLIAQAQANVKIQEDALRIAESRFRPARLPSSTCPRRPRCSRARARRFRSSRSTCSRP